eukprot:9504043-Pyramimonas_sp.AAC.2
MTSLPRGALDTSQNGEPGRSTLLGGAGGGARGEATRRCWVRARPTTPAPPARSLRAPRKKSPRVIRTSPGDALAFGPGTVRTKDLPMMRRPVWKKQKYGDCGPTGNSAQMATSLMPDRL